MIHFWSCIVVYTMGIKRFKKILKNKKCSPITSELLIDHLTHVPPMEMWRDLEKMKLNEPGRQTLGSYRSPVSRPSIQSYILAYYRLWKRDIWSPWTPTRKAFNFCIRGTPPRERIGEKGIWHEIKTFSATHGQTQLHYRTSVKTCAVVCNNWLRRSRGDFLKTNDFVCFPHILTTSSPTSDKDGPGLPCNSNTDL